MSQSRFEAVIEAVQEVTSRVRHAISEQPQFFGDMLIRTVARRMMELDTDSWILFCSFSLFCLCLCSCMLRGRRA